MSNDRSERLRQRRRKSREKAETDENDEPSNSSKPSEPSETDDTGDSSETDEQSVKNERVGTYMYLTDEQKKDMNYLFNQIQTEYEYQYDEEFEKNRHFYPLVIKYGLESLDGLDVSEVRKRIEEMGTD